MDFANVNVPIARAHVILKLTFVAINVQTLESSFTQLQSDHQLENDKWQPFTVIPSYGRFPCQHFYSTKLIKDSQKPHLYNVELVFYKQIKIWHALPCDFTNECGEVVRKLYTHVHFFIRIPPTRSVE